MSSPAPAPAAAAAPPAKTVVVEQAPPPPATTSTAPAPVPAPAPSTVSQKQVLKRSLTDKLLGRKPAHDVEKLSPADEEADTKKKRRRAAAGILGSLCGLLSTLLALSLLGMGLYVLSSYLWPMLTCKMHGYNSHCMFNPYDKSDEHRSVGQWLSDNLPHALGGGFHKTDF